MIFLKTMMFGRQRKLDFISVCMSKNLKRQNESVINFTVNKKIYIIPTTEGLTIIVWGLKNSVCVCVCEHAHAAHCSCLCGCAPGRTWKLCVCVRARPCPALHVSMRVRSGRTWPLSWLSSRLSCIPQSVVTAATRSSEDSGKRFCFVCNHGKNSTRS